MTTVEKLNLLNFLAFALALMTVALSVFLFLLMAKVKKLEDETVRNLSDDFDLFLDSLFRGNEHLAKHHLKHLLQKRFPQDVIQRPETADRINRFIDGSTILTAKVSGEDLKISMDRQRSVINTSVQG